MVASWRQCDRHILLNLMNYGPFWSWIFGWTFITFCRHPSRHCWMRKDDGDDVATRPNVIPISDCNNSDTVITKFFMFIFSAFVFQWENKSFSFFITIWRCLNKYHTEKWKTLFEKQLPITQYLRRWNFRLVYWKHTHVKMLHNKSNFRFLSLSLFGLFKGFQRNVDHRLCSTLIFFFLSTFFRTQCECFAVNLSNEQTNRELKYEIQRPKLDWRQAHHNVDLLPLLSHNTFFVFSSFHLVRLKLLCVCHYSPHSLAQHHTNTFRVKRIHNRNP